MGPTVAPPERGLFVAQNVAPAVYARESLPLQPEAEGLMIDLATEQVLPLSSAPTHPMLQRGRRPGRPIHRSTLERWRLRGCRGVRLETMLFGGQRVTTVEAL